MMQMMSIGVNLRINMANPGKRDVNIKDNGMVKDVMSNGMVGVVMKTMVNRDIDMVTRNVHMVDMKDVDVVEDTTMDVVEDMIVMRGLEELGVVEVIRGLKDMGMEVEVMRGLKNMGMVEAMMSICMVMRALENMDMVENMMAMRGLKDMGVVEDMMNICMALEDMEVEDMIVMRGLEDMGVVEDMIVMRGLDMDVVKDMVGRVMRGLEDMMHMAGDLIVDLAMRDMEDMDMVEGMIMVMKEHMCKD